MIHTNNYLQQASAIPFSTLPSVLGSFDKVYREHFQAANDDPDLNSVIALYYEKLNKYMPKDKTASNSTKNLALKYKYRLRLQLQEQERLQS